MTEDETKPEVNLENETNDTNSSSDVVYNLSSADLQIKLLSVAPNGKGFLKIPSDYPKNEPEKNDILIWLKIKNIFS